MKPHNGLEDIEASWSPVIALCNKADSEGGRDYS